MEEQFEHMDDLIAKHIAGETSAEEESVLSTWRNANNANEKYFQESVNLFRSIEEINISHTVNVDSAWNKIESQISNEGKIIPIFSTKNVLRIAASVLLLVTLSFLVYRTTQNNAEVVTLVAQNKTEQKQLPDGSKVFLNKGAELRFTETGNRREIQLKGEAYFEVLHNENNPFVIEVNGVYIEDIGTAFNVKAHPGSDVVEVLVEEGEVRFYTSDGAGLSLVKGEIAIYDRATKKFSKPENSGTTQNKTAYRSRVFKFDQTQLAEVILQINTVYGTQIQLEHPALESCRVSVQFNNEDPEVIVDILAETLDLQVEQISNGAVILKGEGCDPGR